MAFSRISLAPESGGLVLESLQGKSIELHPLWLSERVLSDHAVDPVSRQRLYEHSELPLNVKVKHVKTVGKKLKIEFSDGFTGIVSQEDIAQELGWDRNPETPPTPTSWDASLDHIPGADWNDLDDPEAMTALLEDYFQHGFCVFRNTPTEKDSLKELSRRFGFLRETNFGEIFNVQTKPLASDMAYTDAALAAHTDNPYRDPVPGIQFLHCLTNEVAGGLSTLVDGMALAEALRDEMPDEAQALEDVIVRFRYHGPSAILEDHGSIIERDHRGFVRHIRLSSRVDYVPAIDPKTLDLFYKGRARLHRLANDTAFQISFPFEPGVLLMMDNYRLLHGRTAFNGKQGHRHLQGCYIDHDGPECLYRMIKNGRVETRILKED